MHSESIAIVISIGIISTIIAFSVYFIFDLWRKASVIEKQIDKAIKIVTFEDNHRKSFYEQKEEIDLKIIALEKYSHSWKEFNEHLIENEDKEQYENSILPEVFFSQDIIVYENINQKHHDAMPGYLTGLGVLGTFIGFSIALTNLDLGNGGIDTKAITGLLQGAKTAFNTSIAGVLSSILYSLLEKYIVRKADKKADDFIDKLEICLKFTNSAQKQQDVIVLLKNIRNNSDSFVNDFISKLEESFSKMLESTIVANVNQGSANIVNALSSIREIQENGQKDMLLKISDQLSGGLQETAASAQQDAMSKFSDLKSMFEDSLFSMHDAQARQQVANDTLIENVNKSTEGMLSFVETSLTSIMDKIGSKLTESTSESAADMQNMLSKGADDMKNKLSESATSISEAFNQISTHFIKANLNLAQIVNDSGERYIEGSKKISSSSEIFRTSLSTIQEQTVKFKEITNSQLTISTTNQTSISRLEGALGKIDNLSEKLTEQSDSLGVLTSLLESEKTVLKTSTEIIVDQWNKHSERFSDVDASLENAFVKIKTGNDQFIDQYKNLIDDIVKKVGSISGSLSTAIEDLAEAVNDGKSENK